MSVTVVLCATVWVMGRGVEEVEARSCVSAIDPSHSLAMPYVSLQNPCGGVGVGMVHLLTLTCQKMRFTAMDIPYGE